MNNRIIKITLTLAMLLIMAVPTQAFAAEKNNSYSVSIYGNNYSAIVTQLMKQFHGYGMENLPAQQFKQAPSQKQTTAAAPTTKSAPAGNTATAAPASANIGAYEQQVVDLVNKERTATGLSALKVNTKLAGMAEKKAEDLRDNNYFDHQSPTYGSPFDMMRQFGISYTSAGENIAKGQRTPDEVMNGWMNSPGHRANIMNTDYTEIGVGYVTDGSGTGYWVQEFIRP
jgi:uncharacterized YkwD family protein